MNVPRAGHTTTLLQTETYSLQAAALLKVVTINSPQVPELYDSANPQFVKTGSMNVARVGHHAISLSSGKVLIFGGWAKAGATAAIKNFIILKLGDLN